MKLTKFWVVRDPSPVSELEDILFETDPVEYVAYGIGTGLSQVKRENTTIYTEKAEALKDATARLAKEKKPGSVYRAPPPGSSEGYTYDRNGKRIRVTIPGRD